MKLGPGSCLLTALFQPSEGSKGIKPWAAKQVGQQGNDMWRAVSHWMMRTLGKLVLNRSGHWKYRSHPGMTIRLSTDIQ